MNTTPDTSSSSDADLESLIQSLPACRRCRDCRRGCDTLLPSCRQCSKAKAECVFYDHGRKEFIPRSYIAKLVEDVQKLSSVAQTPSSVITPSTIASSSTAEAASVSADEHLHSHHFVYASGSYRYLGANSCLLRSPRLQRTEASVPLIPQSEEWEQVVKSCTRTQDLVRTYLDVVQPLYPVLDSGLRFLAPQPPEDLTSADLFALNMVCSIACYVMPEYKRKRDPRWHWSDLGKLDFHHFACKKFRLLAQNYFSKAAEYLEASTMERSIVTLRSVMLLAINSLFDPQSGNCPTMAKPDWLQESELCFDKNKPARYLCSLFRAQRRFRKGDRSVLTLLPRLDETDELSRHPWLRIVLHQTHLLMNPIWQCAWFVLEAVVSQGGFHTFLTPHWVYRAGCVLLDKINEVYFEYLAQLYSNALVALELSSVKWPNVSLLKGSLVDLLKTMKTKAYWGHKEQTYFDLTL
ncbi:uncharacterized protein EI97DRAFT_375495 [Westerdykella ornata]|uniref:Zn(2)-C6 fungal-type domain-containing protein n=1 Tax=Westerdykella ornata TaxID=318751 RepID=A0A6A6JQ03_WESOR|nr:uncharacterized protein EI97DRAFT_375495 [Westerdykella ornata]KAF2277039.1 hypothetical protein EI97DRAFT_375495 [Westerdykella ornata]